VLHATGLVQSVQTLRSDPGLTRCAESDNRIGFALPVTPESSEEFVPTCTRPVACSTTTKWKRRYYFASHSCNFSGIVLPLWTERLGCITGKAVGDGILGDFGGEIFPHYQFGVHLTSCCRQRRCRFGAVGTVPHTCDSRPAIRASIARVKS